MPLGREGAGLLGSAGQMRSLNAHVQAGRLWHRRVGPHLLPDLLHLLLQHILHLPVPRQLGHVKQEVADGLRAALAAGTIRLMFGEGMCVSRKGLRRGTGLEGPQAGPAREATALQGARRASQACRHAGARALCPGTQRSFLTVGNTQRWPALPCAGAAYLCMTSGWYCRPKMRRLGFSIATIAPCRQGGAASSAPRLRR